MSGISGGSGMDAVVVGLLVALTLSVCMALWYALVRPDVVLSLWSEGAATEDGWFEEHSGSLTALRVALGVGVFLLGFLTGLATAFLRSTGG